LKAWKYYIRTAMKLQQTAELQIFFFFCKNRVFSDKRSNSFRKSLKIFFFGNHNHEISNFVHRKLKKTMQKQILKKSQKSSKNPKLGSTWIRFELWAKNFHVSSSLALKSWSQKEKYNGLNFSCNIVDTNFESKRRGSPIFVWHLQIFAEICIL
jgi:hypothetical protein